MRRLAPVAALLLGACSALGLADGLDQESCRACEELNAIEPQADECMRWQCDRVTSLCVVDVRDDDDEETLHERIKVVERRLLVDVLAALATRGVTWSGRKATIG